MLCISFKHYFWQLLHRTYFLLFISSVICCLCFYILWCLFWIHSKACSMAHDCPSLIKNPLCFQGQWDVFAPGWPKQPGGGHGRRIGGLESVTQKWRQQKKQCISSSLMYLLHAFKQKADLSCIAFIICLCLCLCFCVKPTNQCHFVLHLKCMLLAAEMAPKTNTK